MDQRLIVIDRDRLELDAIETLALHWEGVIASHPSPNGRSGLIR
jgi:hypothetical protein